MGKEKNLIKYMQLLLKTTIPLIASSMAGLVMLITDGLCLSRYSKETLAASGPAVFNASLVITLFTGIVSITRVYVAQANGSKDRWKIYVSSFCGIIMAVIMGIILIIMRPLIQFLPELSNRSGEIILLEKQFLGYVPFYGFFVLINCAFSSIFNGILKFKITMVIGLVINILNIFFTVVFVFGYYNFPELGMAGSPIGSLIASVAGGILYIIVLFRSDIFRIKAKLKQNLYIDVKTMLAKMFRVGSLTGVAQTLDEAAQTIFVWVVGGISIISLMANNIALNVNYVIVIPLSGLGAGTTILVANKIGSNEKKSVNEILRAAFVLSFIFIFIVFILECMFSKNIAELFMPQNADPALAGLVIDTLVFLFAYGIGFSVSMIMGGALEAAGLAKYILYVRLGVEYIFCLPIIYFVVKNNIGNDNILRVCWIIYAVFELVIGIIYTIVFHKIGLSQKRLIDDDKELER